MNRKGNKVRFLWYLTCKPLRMNELILSQKHNSSAKVLLEIVRSLKWNSHEIVINIHKMQMQALLCPEQKDV